MEDAPDQTQTAPEPRPAHLAALARERNLRRAVRQNEGRCPYCGRSPEPGHTACTRCRERQHERNQAYLARQRALRDEVARRAAPRRCNHCGSDNLRKAGKPAGRQNYRCRACRRYSNGDGPLLTPRPKYPCPYCKGHCHRRGKTSRNQIRFHCTVCGRKNINLWPADAPSPGGPFPHQWNFCLNYAAKINLMEYIQARGMSVPQAVRDILTRAGHAPLATITSIPRRTYYTGSGDDDYDDLWNRTPRPRTTVIPAPPLPNIPPGGIRVPDLRPEAAHKYASQTGDAHGCPTVLVVWRLSVRLNDAALAGLLAGLLATMQRRKLNHQDAARALLAEAKP